MFTIGYCEIEDKCKKCGSIIQYRVYGDENCDIWIDDDMVICERCKARHRIEVLESQDINVRLID